jgi:hypothetical protein
MFMNENATAQRTDGSSTLGEVTASLRDRSVLDARSVRLCALSAGAPRASALIAVEGWHVGHSFLPWLGCKSS